MPESPDDHFDAANLCELDARWAEANDHYSEAIKLRPDFAEAFDSRAGNRAELGDYAGAVADYQKVLELWPHYAAAHDNLAQIYLDADDARHLDIKLAIAHAKMACELTRNKNYEFLATYARARHAFRNFRKAVKLQQRAVQVARRTRLDKSADRVDQINAEIFLPDLTKDLERFRQDAYLHGTDASLVDRIRSWLTRDAKTDETTP